MRLCASLDEVKKNDFGFTIPGFLLLTFYFIIIRCEKAT